MDAQAGSTPSRSGKWNSPNRHRRKGSSLNGSSGANQLHDSSDSPPTPSGPQMCQLCGTAPAEWHCTNCRFDSMFFCTPCRQDKHPKALNAGEHVVEPIVANDALSGENSGRGGAPMAGSSPAANTGVNVSVITYREGSSLEQAQEGPPGDRDDDPRAAADRADQEYSARVKLPFVPGDDDSTPLPTSHLPDELWRYGDPLLVAYLTWNQASETPPTGAGLADLIKPCGHIICVSTQENGPYVGSSKMQDAWQASVVELLNNPPANPGPSPPVSGEAAQAKPGQRGRRRRWKYHVAGVQAMMATHMTVLVREDVYRHVAMEHGAIEKTGWAGGTVGNKGGIGIAFAVFRQVTKPEVDVEAFAIDEREDRPKTQTQRMVAPGAVASPPRSGAQPGSVATPPPSRRSPPPDKAARSPPPDADFTPREGGADAAGDDGDDAADDLAHSNSGDISGTRGANTRHQQQQHHAKKKRKTRGFISFLFVGSHLAPHQTHVKKRNEDYCNIVGNLAVGAKGPYPTIARTPGSQHGTVTQVAPKVKAVRDCTEEFDVCVFGGDLNYRINGTKFGIENIILNHRSIRAALANNDQLSIERRRGTVFQRFEEGPLLFKPTYKFSKDKTTGLYTDVYDNGPKERLAAYCDRVLYKKSLDYAQPMQLVHYSDVPDIRTSDHLPVAALLMVGTEAPDDDSDAAELDMIPDAEDQPSCCCCVVM